MSFAGVFQFISKPQFSGQVLRIQLQNPNESKVACIHDMKSLVPRRGKCHLKKIAYVYICA